MRKIELDQGTDEWLAWRRSLLTATDAAILLGLSPYCTPYKGWQRKLGDIPEQEVTEPMKRGIREEPKARAMFIEQTGINMIPCCIQSEYFPFIGASLDGISDCGEFILEIKSQRPVTKIPDFHNMQMQHQFLSTDKTVKKGFYVSIWEDTIYPIEVNPDLSWMQEYLIKAKEYWRMVSLREAPPLMAKDYKDMQDNEIWQAYANEYIKIDEQIKHLETIKNSYKTELIDLCGGENCSGHGIKIVKRKIKGRVEFDELVKALSIPEHTIEQYRKAESMSWAIMMDRK